MIIFKIFSITHYFFFISHSYTRIQSLKFFTRHPHHLGVISYGVEKPQYIPRGKIHTRNSGGKLEYVRKYAQVILPRLSSEHH